MQGNIKRSFVLHILTGLVVMIPCSFIMHWDFQLAREVLDIAAKMVKPGVTTEEIDHAVHLVHTHIWGSPEYTLLHSSIISDK